MGYQQVPFALLLVYLTILRDKRTVSVYQCEGVSSDVPFWMPPPLHS